MRALCLKLIGDWGQRAIQQANQNSRRSQGLLFLGAPKPLPPRARWSLIEALVETDAEGSGARAKIGQGVGVVAINIPPSIRS